jgi:phospholipid/cholesterol/gamma-HCH transport system ATP-binding protein
MRSSISFRASLVDVAAHHGDVALAATGLTGPAERPVIHDITFELRRGETMAVVGPIQSGKSTLVRHLLGLDLASRGVVQVDKVVMDAADPAPRELRDLRRCVGVLFESSALLQHITALENVELPLVEHSNASRKEARQSARELLMEAGVNADERTTPVELGRAEQRRVALARAVALDPAVLVLDEPTVGLDSHAAHQFDETVMALQSRYGFGVLMLSREVRHAFVPGRRVAVMENGRFVAVGDIDALMRSDIPVVKRLLHRRGAAV